MRKVLGTIVVVVLISAAACLGWAYSRLTSLSHERITDDVFVVHGFGGNVAVLRTDAGAVVVDSMTFPIQGSCIGELARELTGKPVVMIINTHYHRDHTQGNPGLPSAMRIVSTASTREHMLDVDGWFWRDHRESLPAETFVHEHEISIGGKTIKLLHPGRGHTDGDLIALFVEDRVAHFGDLLFNARYPNIDLEAGGSVQEWPATLDRAAELDFEHVIPGHGELTDRDGIARFRAFIVELWDAGHRAAELGWTLEETLARVELTRNRGMQDYRIPFVLTLDRDFVVRRVWEEATGAVHPRDADPT
jgi:glyoxylase-like metal-dependent hydrolase (beta-lactamase superfamily II)